MMHQYVKYQCIYGEWPDYELCERYLRNEVVPPLPSSMLTMLPTDEPPVLAMP